MYYFRDSSITADLVAYVSENPQLSEEDPAVNVGTLVLTGANIIGLVLGILVLLLFLGIVIFCVKVCFSKNANFKIVLVF